MLINISNKINQKIIIFTKYNININYNLFLHAYYHLKDIKKILNIHSSIE